MRAPACARARVCVYVCVCVRARGRGGGEWVVRCVNLYPYHATWHLFSFSMSVMAAIHAFGITDGTPQSEGTEDQGTTLKPKSYANKEQKGLIRFIFSSNKVR